MRPISKDLPDRREDYSFGDLVYWHLFVYGTRPDGDPDKPVGRRWIRLLVPGELKVSDRTLRYWINDSHPPKDIAKLCEVLFGNNPRWDASRQELHDKFDRLVMRAAATTIPSPPTAPLDEPDPAPAQPVVNDQTVRPNEPKETSSSDAPVGKSNDVANDRVDGQPPRDELEPSRAVIVAPVRALTGTEPPPPSLPRWIPPAFLAATVAALGAYWWMQVRGERPRPETPPVAQTIPPPVAQPKKSAPAAIEPKPGPTKQATAPAPKQEPSSPVRPEAQPTPPRVAEQPKQQPALPKVTKAPPDPPALSEEEQAKIKARQEAFDREQEEKEKQAALADMLDGDPGAAQRARDAEARQLAGLGYRLRENMSVQMSPLATMPTASVAECARACQTQDCDGFAFARQARYCYLFKRPFSPSNNPGHVFGERLSDPPESKGPLRKGAIAPESLVILSQGGAPPAEGIARCSAGPVKVSGFKLACDTILGGGTSPRTPQERFMVRNINECAAKCRPTSTCTGFAFNSGDPEGQHACQLFGGRPEARESLGWISGQR